MPFMIIAGCKDTLRGQGLNTPEIQRLPAALAVRPSFRPDLNLTKENTSSYCVVTNPQQQCTGWYTAGPLEHSLQMHRELTETEEQVEMQLKPASVASGSRFRSLLAQATVSAQDCVVQSGSAGRN